VTINNEERSYGVSTNLGGGIFIYDITDLDEYDFDADTPRGITDADPEFVASWTSGLSVSDLEVPTNVWSVVADVIDNSPSEDDDAYLYVSLVRGGVKVLEFDPTAPEPLTSEMLIQTGWRTAGMHLRDKNGEKTLLVTDHGAGVRLYGKPDSQ